MIKSLFLILNAFIIVIVVIFLTFLRKNTDESCPKALFLNSEDEGINRNDLINEDALLNKYVQKLSEFLRHGHEHFQNMTAVERRLSEKIKETIQSNQSFSSFMQVLPRYDKTTYKELIKVSWFSYDEYNKWPTLPHSLRKFQRAFEFHEQKLLDQLIEMMFNFFAVHEIEFMIADGTLIGSLRHFDRIPWDDDLDFIVRLCDRDKIIEFIRHQTLFSDLEVLNYTSTIKIYHKSSKKVGRFPWNFPFIDVFPSDENATHLNREFYGSYYNASKNNIYPLVLRPIGKYWLPAPKDGEAFETQIKSPKVLEDCFSTKMNHRSNFVEKADKLDCKKLTAFYPFTERMCKSLKDSNVCMEFLKLVDKTIYLFYFDDRPIALRLG